MMMPKIDTDEFWRNRYANGGTAGPGSAGEPLRIKSAMVIGAIVSHGWYRSPIVDWGCGDGAMTNALLTGLPDVPFYMGIDVSPVALLKCATANRHHARTIVLAYPTTTVIPPPHVAVSADVIMHLVHDGVYRAYMDRLFGPADVIGVVMYSSDASLFGYGPTHWHCRHRDVTRDVAQWYPWWRLDEIITDVRAPYPALVWTRVT